MKFELENGETLNREYLDTFWIPSKDQRENLLPGEIVKLIFRISYGNEASVERMWVTVKSAY